MADKNLSFKPDGMPVKEIFIRGVVTRNPVLVQAIGLCPLIAVVTSALNGLAIALVSSFILFVSEFFTCLFLKKTTRWVRVGIYALIGVALIAPINYYMDIYMHELTVSLGIYIPLLAVNSLSLFRCEGFASKTSKLKSVFFDALASGLGYTAVLVLTGIIREAFGSSKIFGVYIDALPRAKGMLMPFAGFITIGFLGAFLNWIIKRTKIEAMSEISLAKRIKNDESIIIRPDVIPKKKKASPKKTKSKESQEKKAGSESVKRQDKSDGQNDTVKDKEGNA